MSRWTDTDPYYETTAALEKEEAEEWRRHATPAQRFAAAEAQSKLIRDRDKLEN